MKKSRKLSAIILATIMALSVYSPTNATESVLQEASSKIKPDLQSVLLSSGKNDEIPVDIWLYEPFSTEQLEKEIDSKIGITRQKINQSEEKNISAEKVDEYIETERALYSEKMNALYKDFLKDYSKVKALNETREGKRLFFSQYAPLISAELTPAEIKQLAKDERVQYVYYSPNVEAVAESNISIPLIQAAYVRNYLEFTGSGIKIGMIESDGVPNKNNNYFTYANITYDPSITNPNYTDHANRVAAIMVAKSTTVDGVTYEGIVPDAELYATYTNTNDSVDWRAKAEWLLFEGVDVINMSAGWADNLGIYGTRELWVDHIALNHCVHFVKSAGNRGEGDAKINSPGMAYNVITVGAINDYNTTSKSDDNIADYSSYLENSNIASKPDLVAPGTDITTAAGTDSGTSFAAPHVAAVVAQMCQKQPSLKTQPDTVKAILTSSITHTRLAFTSADSDYNKYGAGVVNAQAAVGSINTSRYIQNSFEANATQGTSHFYEINAPTTKKRRISLSWLKYSYFTGAHTGATPIEGTLNNLDITIYDSEGNALLSSSTINTTNNTKIIEFSPPEIGTYTMKVSVTGSSNKITYYSVAWY